MQTRLESFIETIINTLIGFFVALLIWPVCGIIFDLQYNTTQHIGSTMLFTAASVLRGYVIRRWCQRYLRDLSMYIANKFRKLKI